jgi:predicted ThiF/HesA family dinucleotide-utilizing enzyme
LDRKALVVDGDDGIPTTSFPLGECSGDCDSDDECFGDLACFQRNGTEAVPGCAGTGTFAQDYCYKTTGTGVFSYVGDEDVPIRAFPLGNCEGDCDADADCAAGLRCWKSNDPVPGCTGTKVSGKEYCYSVSMAPTSAPSSSSPTSAPSPSATKTLQDDGDNGIPTTSFPLGECSGDCDSDDECFGDLVCFERNGTEAVPGCAGTGTFAQDYCYKTTGTGVFSYVGDEDVPIRAFPLGNCEGDCDSDADCAAGLRCWKSDTPVPGCTGTKVSGKEYCYSVSMAPTSAPSSSAPTSAPSPSAAKTLRDDGDDGLPTTSFPLGECSGDCDSDDECFGDLACFQRNGTEAVPGCAGTGTFAQDYCYKTTGTGVFSYVGDEDVPIRAFPLGICEGDCDADADCAAGLRCWKNDTPVPGCTGTQVSGKEYCYDVSLTPTSAPGPPPTAETLRDDGNDGLPTTSFPLGECSGDCDSDDECFGDLACFERNGTEAVPGCAGTGTFAQDYCYKTTGTGVFAYVGDEDVPIRAFPLGNCEGDCDSDADCAAGLLCWKNDTPVPGCTGTKVSGKEYCYAVSMAPTSAPSLPSKPLRDDGDDGLPTTSFPLAECSGDCDANGDCFGDMACFQRNGTEAVPGCAGTGTSSQDYCYKPNGTTALAYTGDNNVPTRSFPLGNCEGDCDNDADCAVGHACFQRGGVETVPGCTGLGLSGKDYCYKVTASPTSAPSLPSKPLRDDGDDGLPTTSFPLAECSGDCDANGDCFGDMACFQRNGTEAVPGCAGTGTSSQDYCYKPNGTTALAYTGDNNAPTRSFPLGNCEGDCDNDADCAVGHACFQRGGVETVPGCTGLGLSGKDYCYKVTAPPPSLPPTLFPTQQPVTSRPTVPGGPSYVPGDLTIAKAGFRLSAGLDVRVIATKGFPVQFANGGQSSASFHVNPDAATVFEKSDNSGNYYYVSNSETGAASTGGVGSIEFDSNGNVVGYERVLNGTSQNCGGGRSPYNTWLSAEEFGARGFVWEVSPENAFVGRKTNLVPYGGNFESVAYHYNEVLGRNIYYTTEDSSTGPLIQFIPSDNLGTREEMYSTGTHKYLRVDTGSSGTFSWESTKAGGTASLYRGAEGIDIKDGILYFVSKTDRYLFILNLADGTFTRETTVHGAVSMNHHTISLLPYRLLLYNLLTNARSFFSLTISPTKLVD